MMKRKKNKKLLVRLSSIEILTKYLTRKIIHI